MKENTCIPDLNTLLMAAMPIYGIKLLKPIFLRTKNQVELIFGTKHHVHMDCQIICILHEYFLKSRNGLLEIFISPEVSNGGFLYKKWEQILFYMRILCYMRKIISITVNCLGSIFLPMHACLMHLFSPSMFSCLFNWS